jgi:hypothetical protein
MSQKNVKKYLIYFKKPTKSDCSRQVVGLGLCVFAVFDGIVAERTFLMNERKMRAVFA